MDATAWFALRSVDEGIEVEKFVVNKPGRFETGSRRVKVRSSDQYINITRITDGILINPRDPLGDGVSDRKSVV